MNNLIVGIVCGIPAIAIGLYGLHELSIALALVALGFVAHGTWQIRRQSSWEAWEESE